MWLTFSGDSGCYAASSYITPSGTYRYNTVNPNEQITSATNDPANQKLYHWLHSKALTRGSYSTCIFRRTTCKVQSKGLNCQN